jgi:hypothetical protein
LINFFSEVVMLLPPLGLLMLFVVGTPLRLRLRFVPTTDSNTFN